jgi:hypothetical protein
VKSKPHRLNRPWQHPRLRCCNTPRPSSTLRPAPESPARPLGPGAACAVQTGRFAPLGRPTVRERSVAPNRPRQPAPSRSRPWRPSPPGALLEGRQLWCKGRRAFGARGAGPRARGTQGLWREGRRASGARDAGPSARGTQGLGREGRRASGAGLWREGRRASGARDAGPLAGRATRNSRGERPPLLLFDPTPRASSPVSERGLLFGPAPQPTHPSAGSSLVQPHLNEGSSLVQHQRGFLFAGPKGAPLWSSTVGRMLQRHYPAATRSAARERPCPRCP